MPKASDQKYLQKKVKLGSMEMTLYSLDGHTWSSRKDELHIIKERQESGRVTLDPKAGGKGQQSQRFLPKKPAPKGVDADEESGFEDEELFEPEDELEVDVKAEEEGAKPSKQKKTAAADSKKSKAAKPIRKADEKAKKKPAKNKKGKK